MKSKHNGLNLTFVKYLVGKSGDVVKKVDDKVYVNSELIGSVKNNEGLAPIEGGVIPEGYVFVAGTHADSLDSRYKEFGLIKESELKGRGIVPFEGIGWLKRH
jgi:conjugal transfer pilin signal peptidase TrbI